MGGTEALSDTVLQVRYEDKPVFAMYTFMQGEAAHDVALPIGGHVTAMPVDEFMKGPCIKLVEFLAGGVAFKLVLHPSAKHCDREHVARMPAWLVPKVKKDATMV